MRLTRARGRRRLSVHWSQPRAVLRADRPTCHGEPLCGTTCCGTRHAPHGMPRATCLRPALAGQRRPTQPRVGLFVCLFVCSTDQQEDRHQGAHRLAVPHARVALCVCEYPHQYPVSTPTSPGPARPPPVLRGTAGYSPVPPRVQVPHADLRYCGVLRVLTATRTDGSFVDPRAGAKSACVGSVRWRSRSIASMGCRTSLPHAATRTEHYSTGLGGRTTLSAQSARARSCSTLLGRCAERRSRRERPPLR